MDEEKMKLIKFGFLSVVVVLSASCSGGSGKASSTGSSHPPGTDTTSPTIGTAIAFSNVDYTSLTVGWGAATDETTSSSQLSYKLVMSSDSTTIDSVSEVDALSGASVIADWTANTTTANVSGLTESTQYHFAVLVKDASGNKALYGPSSQTTPTQPPPSNLVSHWKFDGSVNDVFGSNHFTQAGSASSFSSSVVKFGTQSLHFNGTDQYLTSNFDFGGVTNFTMAGWVYMESYPASYSTSPATKIGFWGQNDLIEMGLSYGGSPTPLLRLCLWVAGSSDACDTQQFPIGQWVHVAVTGSTTAGTQVFFNGVRVATSTNISAGTSTDKLNVGYGVWPPPGDLTSREEFFHGYIDELAIWNRVLSDSEIQDLANL
jgi:hypothetical protein